MNTHDIIHGVVNLRVEVITYLRKEQRNDFKIISAHL